MIFSIVTVMQLLPLSSSKTFSWLQNRTPYPLNSYPILISTPLPGPGNHNLFSLCMDLPILNILHKWNHKIYDFWVWPFSFYAKCTMYWNTVACISISFFSWLNSIPLYVSNTVYQSIDELLHCFHLLAIVNCATMNICIQMFEYLFSIFSGR